MVFGATDKTPPRRESFPARAPRGPRCPGHPLAGHTARPAHRRGRAAPDHAPRAAPPSPRLLPGCHSARDDGPELWQRSPVDTEIALAQLGESTDRLLATADALTDAQVAAPSRLPGWTRGHVLTHLARNADGFRNLLSWAATGNETPMYPSEEARARGVEEGAARSAAEISGGPAEERGRARRGGAGPAGPGVGRPGGPARRHVPGAADPAAPAGRAGDPPRRPGRRVPAGRLAGQLRGGEPGPGGPRFRWARRRASLPGPPGWPGCRLPDRPAPARTGPAQARSTVSGPPAALLAWLIGRDDGAGLRVTGAGAVPVLPPWR